MTKGILGKKVGMTQIFTEAGEFIPVTVIEVGLLLELLFIPAQAQPPILMVVLLSSLITQ